MFDIYYQKESDEIENIREMLRISHDRCNQLVSLNNQAIGIVTAILIGLITFLGSAYFTSQDPNRYLSIVIAIHVSITTLIFWRYYAHAIDTDIVNSYNRIILAETKLKIPFELSLVNSLEKNLYLQEIECYPFIEKMHRARIILKLIECNRIGDRYHGWWDFFAALITFFLLFFQLGFVILGPDPIPAHYYFGFLVFAPSLYGALFFLLREDEIGRIKIPKDPTETELLAIIRETMM